MFSPFFYLVVVLKLISVDRFQQYYETEERLKHLGNEQPLHGVLIKAKALKKIILDFLTWNDSDSPERCFWIVITSFAIIFTYINAFFQSEYKIQVTYKRNILTCIQNLNGWWSDYNVSIELKTSVHVTAVGNDFIYCYIWWVSYVLNTN